MKQTILTIDDDQKFLESIESLLKIKKYNVETLNNPTKINSTNLEEIDLVLTDVKMPAMDGIDILQEIHNKNPQLPVIMISGQSNLNTAVKALKLGAYDFIEKPVDPDKLISTVKNALNTKQIIEEKENIFSELANENKLIGNSECILKLKNKIKQVSGTNAKVLIEGENGTGKELVAWALHHYSDRKGKPYIKLNCAAIPSELLESELFGHMKGSFTGAVSNKQGKFLAADGGTLFLDEIGDMSIDLQAKLLRVLENNELEIIGANTVTKVDVRIISATNQDLQEKINSGTFREDLFHRLNVIRLEVPPLRTRKEDIESLANYFISKYCSDYNKSELKLSRQALGILTNYDWPGNVRELRNIVEKVVVYNETNDISADDIIEAFSENKTKVKQVFSSNNNSLQTAKEEFEIHHILKILDETEWKLSKAAEVLEIDRSNLFRKMQKYGISK